MEQLATTPMNRAVLFLLPLVFATSGCLTIKTEHEVKPIHITMDVNLNVKVDKALNDFFGDLDQKATTPKP
jgi:hypothetical protein